MPSFYSSGLLAAAATLLTGCAVYAPIVPTTPLLEAKQLEVTASLRGLTAVQAGAAWSPVPHLLLTGETALQGGITGSTTTNNVTTDYNDYHVQMGVGAGIYQAPTDQSGWYLAAVGGLGFAKAEVHAVDVDIVSPYVPVPLPSVSGSYEASYWRHYGQLYAAHPMGKRLVGGFSLRANYIDYTQLTYGGRAIEPANHFFIEPTLFLRLGQGAVRGQATVGLSLPTSSEATHDLSKRTAPVSGLVSVGVVVRPDLIRWLHRN